MRLKFMQKMQFLPNSVGIPVNWNFHYNKNFTLSSVETYKNNKLLEQFYSIEHLSKSFNQSYIFRCNLLKI